MSLSAEDRREIEALIAERAGQPLADIRARLTTEQDPEILAGRLRRLRDRVDAIAGTADGGTGNPGGSGGTGGTPAVGDLGELFTPGDANTPGAAVAYESRKRGGNTTLVGHSELTSPSTPAKKYRIKTFSGNLASTAYMAAGCTTAAPSGGPISVTGGIASFSASGSQLTVTYGFSGTQNGGRFTAVDVTNPSQIFYRDGVGVNNVGSLPITMTAGTTYTIRLRYFPTGVIDGASETQTLTYTYEPTQAESLAYTGTSSYDVTTGALTDAGSVTGFVINTGTGALDAVSASITSVDDASSRLGTGNFTTATDTATQHALNRSNTCEQIGASTYYRKVTSCTLKDTLSAEDTDSNGITRLLAGAGGTYGSWGAAGAFPNAAAVYAARTTGFTFTYEQTQLKATYTGMPAGWAFKVRVRLSRVKASTGAVSTVTTSIFNPTADGDGEATWTINVEPAEAGYTYRVQSVDHFL